MGATVEQDPKPGGEEPVMLLLYQPLPELLRKMSSPFSAHSGLTRFHETPSLLRADHSGSSSSVRILGEHTPSVCKP